MKCTINTNRYFLYSPYDNVYMTKIKIDSCNHEMCSYCRNLLIIDIGYASDYYKCHVEGQDRIILVDGSDESWSWKRHGAMFI